MKDEAYWDRVAATVAQIPHLLQLPLDLLQRMWATSGKGEQVMGFDHEAIHAAMALRVNRTGWSL